MRASRIAAPIWDLTYGTLAAVAPRYILAENLRMLMRERPDLNTLAKITARTGVSNGTLDRIRRAEVATTVDVLELLAAAFELEAWELLVPAARRTLLHRLRLVAEAAPTYAAPMGGERETPR